MKRYVCVLFAIVLLAVFCGCTVPENQDVRISKAGNDSNDVAGAVVTGELAGFESETLDGQKFTADYFAGNTITVINVWATWCQPCVGELASFEKLNNSYRDKDVSVIGILFDSEDDGMIIEGMNILAEKGATYTQLRMSESAHTMLEEAYQVAAMPTTFFVDSNGDVIRTEVGANSYDGWASILEGLLK